MPPPVVGKKSADSRFSVRASVRASIHASVRRGSLLIRDVVVASFSDEAVSDGRVTPEPLVGPSSSAAPPAAADSRSRHVSSLLRAAPDSMLTTVFHSTLMAAIPAMPAILLLYLYFELLAPELRKRFISPSSLSHFIGVGALITDICVMRRREARMRRLSPFQMLASMLFTALFIYLWGGDVGLWTVPMCAVMFVLTLTVCYPMEPTAKDRKANFFKYFLSRIPVPVVAIFTIAVPPASSVFPAQLLSKYPWAYALFCGIGYPSMSFIVRKGFTSYMQNIFRKRAREGQISVEQMATNIAQAALLASVSLQTGNVILLYQSTSKTSCLLGALASILTEVAGKLFTTKVTRLAMQQYLESDLHNFRVRAQAEAGVSHNIDEDEDLPDEQDIVVHFSKAVTEFRPEVEGLQEEAARLKGGQREIEGGGAATDNVETPLCDVTEKKTPVSSEEEAKEIDDKRSRVYWDDFLTMLALRWTNDNLAEKGCIIVAAYASTVLGMSPHGTRDQVEIFMYFMVCEIIADAVLIYSLERWFNVPFRRITSPSFRSLDFWCQAFLTCITFFGGSMIFYYYQETANSRLT